MYDEIIEVIDENIKKIYSGESLPLQKIYTVLEKEKKLKIESAKHHNNYQLQLFHDIITTIQHEINNSNNTNKNNTLTSIEKEKTNVNNQLPESKLYFKFFFKKSLI